MKKQITDALVRSVAVPAEGRIEISDTARPGLRLRVSSNGRRVWMFEKRVKGGAKRKHTFGTYPELSIKEARAMALEIEIEAMKGVDRIGDAVRIPAPQRVAVHRVTDGRLWPNPKSIGALELKH